MNKDTEDLLLVKPIQPKPQQKAVLKIGEQQIELPVIEDVFGNKMIDVRTLLGKAKLMTYDPGFMSTASCMSNISHIEVQKGQLFYRGYKIQDLVQNSSFMQTCYLLFYGLLPSKNQLQKFQQVIVGEMMINEKMIEFYKGFRSQAHPMAIMVGVVGALSAFKSSEYDLFDTKDRRQIQIKLIAKMPTLAAYAYRTAKGLPIVYPKKQYGYMKNLLYMMFSNPMNNSFEIDQRIIKALQVIWICHAQHQQGPSTSTVRIAGSSLANPFACIAAGIGSLWGPSHGGADQAVLNMFQMIQKQGKSIQQVIERAKDKSSNFRLMGFGHRIYKTYDPRAKIMQNLCRDILNIIDDPQTVSLLDLALSIEKKVSEDEYFKSRRLYPNIDFFTGIVYKAIGIPKEMFTVLFAVSRSVGWVSHWCEMMNQNTSRISRPRQLYVGPDRRQYVPIQQRQDSDSRIHQIPKLCKITSLMKL